MPALNPVTTRPVIKHRWDGKTFHVKVFNCEADAQGDTAGPWYDQQRMARACWEQAQKAPPPPAPAAPIPDVVEDQRKVAIAEALTGDRRKALFAEAKKLGLRVFGGISTEELDAKVTEASRTELADAVARGEAKLKQGLAG